MILLGMAQRTEDVSCRQLIRIIEFHIVNLLHVQMCDKMKKGNCNCG
jgi:hypothetical protein